MLQNQSSECCGISSGTTGFGIQGSQDSTSPRSCWRLHQPCQAGSPSLALTSSWSRTGGTDLEGLLHLAGPVSDQGFWTVPNTDVQDPPLEIWVYLSPLGTSICSPSLLLCGCCLGGLAVEVGHHAMCPQKHCIFGWFLWGWKMMEQRWLKSHEIWTRFNILDFTGLSLFPHTLSSIGDGSRNVVVPVHVLDAHSCRDTIVRDQ